MAKIYNKQSGKLQHRYLRRNMTKAEVLLWVQLKNKKISGQRFLRQFGILTFPVDFCCPKLKLIIEVDGVTHITQQQKEYDRRRQAEIESFGFEFLRFTNSEIYSNMNGVIDKITQKIQQRIVELGQNPPNPPFNKGGIKGLWCFQCNCPSS